MQHFVFQRITWASQTHCGCMCHVCFGSGPMQHWHGACGHCSTQVRLYFNSYTYYDSVGVEASAGIE